MDRDDVEARDDLCDGLDRLKIPPRPILARRTGTLWYPTLAVGSDMAESLAHVEILAGEVGLRVGICDPGSTNLGGPDAEGLPVGIVYSNSYDGIRHAEVIALRANMIVVQNVVNSIIDDLQAYGLTS